MLYQFKTFFYDRWTKRIIPEVPFDYYRSYHYDDTDTLRMSNAMFSATTW